MWYHSQDTTSIISATPRSHQYALILILTTVLTSFFGGRVMSEEAVSEDTNNPRSTLRHKVIDD